jgi:subtilisin
LKKQLLALIILCLITISLAAPTTLAEKSDENDEVRVIVGFKDANHEDIESTYGGKVSHKFDDQKTVACSITQKDVDKLRNDPRVEYVEEDYPVYALATSIELSNSWGVTKIGADKVWTATPNNQGDGIKVAVIDTGINYNHPDLDGNCIIDGILGGINYVTPTAPPMDDNGHGSHCAGIIAAEDDGTGVVGVAPKAHLYAVKVLDSTGSGYTSNVVAGINWAIANDMDVISMSLGSPYPSTSLQTACNNAQAAGIVVVAASGNDGRASISYPARYPSVIAVGAVDSNNVRASWSNYGAELAVVAPGVAVYSTVLSTAYATYSGTSMATPHVAGTAALVLASGATNENAWNAYGLTNHDEIWSPAEVRNVLTYTADDLGASGKDNYYGYGLVDADQAALIPPAPPVILQQSYNPTTAVKTLGTITGTPALLSASDDLDLSVKSQKANNYQTIDWYSGTSIAQASSSVTSLTITYEGSYTSSKTQTLYLYNFVTGQWQSLGTKTVGTTDLPITYTIASPLNYISNTLEIRLRTYATQRTSNSFTCNADFTQIIVKYTAPTTP